MSGRAKGKRGAFLPHTNNVALVFVRAAWACACLEETGSMKTNVLRLWAAWAFTAALLAGGGQVASAQEPAAVAKVKALNDKAIEAYESLDLDQARTYLMEALEVCAAEGLNRHPVKAVAHLNLGIVLVGGLKEQEAGILQFRRAAEIDPKVRIPKRLTNPEIEAAFETGAKQALGRPTPAPTEAQPAPAPPKPAAGGARGRGAPGSGITHDPVRSAVGGQEISLTADVASDLQFDRLVLAYRPDGASGFLAREMEPDATGAFTARIPVPATLGASVAYYVEARGSGAESVAQNGTADEPHLVELAQSEGVAITEPGMGAPDFQESARVVPGGQRLYFAFGVGAGFGQAKGNPEVNPEYRVGDVLEDIEVNSMAAARLVHFAPEVGYFLSDRLLLSLQGRLQVTTGATEVHHTSCGDSGVCEPATGAIAFLGHATWLFGQGAFRPFASFALGGGAIRYLVDLGNYLQECGPTSNETCFDTIAAAGLMAGPSAGLLYALSDSLYLTAALNTLLVIPNASFNADLNLGLAFRM